VLSSDVSGVSVAAGSGEGQVNPDGA